MSAAAEIIEARSGFGGLVDVLTVLIGHFDNRELAFGIALVILVLAGAIAVYLHLRRHRPWIGPIRRVSRELRQLAVSQTDPGQRLAAADEIFEQTPILAPLWREYAKHFRQDPKAGGYVNLVDARLWFSTESIPGRGYEQWCATWAGVFLTLGLLFTFVGLSAALLKVADIGAADSATMKAAITDILGVSSAKFITSIAGLIAYIGFSLITRRYQSSQQTAARELADAIQHLGLPRTPESLLYEQTELAREQLLRLERFTDDLAVAIDTKLEQRLSMLAADLGQHFGAIQQSLPDATAKPIVDAIQNMTQTVATEFSTQVRQTAGGEIGAVAEQFSAVAAELAKLKDGMGGAGQAFGADILKAAADLRDATEKMGRDVEGRSKDLEDRIGQFSNRLNDISGSLGQIPENISRSLNETLSKLTGAVDALVERLAQGGEQGASALSVGGEEAGKKLKASADQAGKGLKEKLGEVSAKLDEIAGTLGRVPENISLTLNETLSNLTEAVDALVERLAQGGEQGASALSVGGEEAGKKLKASAEQAGKGLKEKLGEVSTKLDEIAGTLGRVPENISLTLNETLSKLTGAVDTLVEQLAQGGKDSGEALRSSGQDAGNRILEAVDQAGTGFDRTLNQATEHLVTQFTGVLTKLEAAIQALAGRLQLVESGLRSLPEAVAAQVQQLNRAGQTFENAGQTVVNAGSALQQATQPLQRTAATMQTSLEQIRSGVAEATAIHQQAQQSVRDALSDLKAASDAAHRTFVTHEKRFGEVDEELAKALVTLRDGVDEVAREMQNAFAEYNTQIAQTVGNLSNWGQGLEDAVYELAESIKK